MKTPFFITGLPRSRTAWLANLFTTDRTLCFHEPVKRVGELIAENSLHQVGVSDAGMTLRFMALRAAFPTAPWLYVERDEQEAMSSLMKFDPPSRAIEGQLLALCEMHLAAARIIKKDRAVLVVNFDDLNAMDVVARAWRHLLPATPFNAARWRILDGLKVEQRIEAAMAERGMR